MEVNYLSDIDYLLAIEIQQQEQEVQDHFSCFFYNDREDE